MSILEKVCDSLGITAEASYSNKAAPESFKDCTPWRVKLTRKSPRRTLTVDFYTGSAICEEPTAADVLSCLCSDSGVAAMDFEEFCLEFGYDNDSRKAESTYKACCATAPKVSRFLGDDFDRVAQAEH